MGPSAIVNSAVSATAGPEATWVSGSSASADYLSFASADVANFLAQAAELGPAAARTPFQSAPWLASIYEHIVPAKAAQPLLVTATERSSGRVAMMLPLIARRVGGLRVVEFADLGISDYNFPILGPAAPRSPGAAAAAWRAIVACLPHAADLVRLSKLPVAFDGCPNPLALRSSRPAPNFSNSVALPATWDAYLQQRSKQYRKILRQKQRGIDDMGGTCHIVVETGQALAALSALEDFQARRVKELGQTFHLSLPAYSRFYRDVIERGVDSRQVLVSVIRAGDQIVAATLGLINGASCTMIRLGHVGGKWSRHSPSVVLVSRTIAWLIANRITHFDMGVGAQPYKQRFGCERQALHSLEHALTAKGRLAATVIVGIDRFRDSRIGRSCIAGFHKARSRQHQSTEEVA